MKEKLSRFSKKMLQHELIRGSSYLFLGTFFANVLAFLFNLFVLRKFSPSDYGDYASIMSLFTILVLPSTSLGTIIVKFATDYFSQNHIHKAKKLFQQIFLFILVISVVFFVILFLGSQSLLSFFHIKEGVLLVWLGAIVFVSYLSMINTAFLQSILRFDFVAITAFVGSLLKLLFGILFILLSLHTSGIFMAVFLSGFVAYIVSFYPLRSFLKEKATGAATSVKELVVYALPASIAIFSLSSFTSTDVLLVKHFFSPSTAGIYAGLSLIGRIIFYLTTPIASVMFPLLIKRRNKGENVTSLLLLSSVLVVGPGVFLTAGYFLFPNLVIEIFFGGRHYPQYSQYVGFFGIFLTLFSAINILVSFFLSLNKTKISFLVLLGAILQAVLIFAFHRDIYQLLSISIGISLVLLVLLLLYYGKVYGEIKKGKEVPLSYSPGL
ncbi:MAG: oligosaccharide flippase family protein [Patescibacteria group bacterium]|nr:oligosaccharide flippase family protein [Patescibacteria group bacterium]